MSNDPRLDPSTISNDYAEMLPKWAKIRTLLAGTEAMRAAQTTYLPQFPKEPDLFYDYRLKSTTLLNMSEITLNSWVGRPFSDPVNVGDDVPEQLVELFKNVDLKRNGLSTFLRDWFREGLAFAHAHVLVDMPRVDKEGRTRADDLRDGLRPFWSFLRPEAVIFLKSVFVGDQEVLVHARILETETRMNGFTEEEVRKIRVFDRVFSDDPEVAGVFVRAYTWQRTANKKVDWVLTELPSRIDLDEIPLVTFYADRSGIQKGKPPLEDLVDLNIAHWQSGSDQRNVLTVTRFPIVAASGVNPEEANNVVLAPRKVLATRSENGKFYYLEHSGAAVKVGAEDLAKLEEQMAHYGADFLRKRPGGLTATARALDSAEATSPLQDSVNRFNEAVANAVRLTGKWLGVEDPGTVTVPVDFGPEEVVGDDLTTLREARKMRDLSRPKFLEELRRRGVVADDFDADENETEIEAEASVFGGAALGDFGDEDDQAGT